MRLTGPRLGLNSRPRPLCASCSTADSAQVIRPLDYTGRLSVPLSGKTMCSTPKVLEVQERAQGPLSSCQVWWGSNFTRHREAKNVEFFVCLSVCSSVCVPDFAMKALEYRNEFDIVG